MSNIFDETEEYSEWQDLESEGAQATQPKVDMDTLISDIDSDYQSDSDNNSSYSLDMSEKQIMQQSIMRLGQARLYEMFLKHDLFGEVDVEESVKRVVEKELKTFILERLQILLGIKREPEVVETQVIQQITTPPQFNDIEVEFLKALSNKGTGGASSKGVTTQPLPVQTTSVVSKPKDVLTTMSSSSTPTKTLKTMSPPIKKPIEKKVKQNNKASNNKLLDLINNHGLNQKEAEAVLRDLEMPNNKRPNQMSASELRERNSKINNKKPVSKVPIPDADALMLHYATNMNKDTKTIAGLFAQARGVGLGQIETIDSEYDD